MALALYRKYRPQTFAEVIGQEQVTEPLTQALRSGRLHHAYLFSGPRGCGKTSSARILARSLNCANGPTPDPCGQCESCLALGPDGPGSIDVIEIDAASHGGVDDARDLRERAFFAPVSSRFKVYVIDEAHMVSTQGFNALLKLVEEPPEYVTFIFATTEPEKVLGTIRSRTHHYPFRLIPSGVLRPYLEHLCREERVAVEPAVFPLVVRAGGGSARDSLSVLDQLIGGAGPGGVTYARAVGLLGVTDVGLIDEMTDALAAGDGAAAFATIDRVADAGHDSRRYAADLLERLRDLIILQRVPDAAASGIIDAPADQLERMTAQAGRMGQATVSRLADIVHNGLTEMRGTTAPRLLLELVVARMLLPGAEDTHGALLQRLERMERRLGAASPDGVPSVDKHSLVDGSTHADRLPPSDLEPDAPTRPAPAARSAPASRSAPTAPARQNPDRTGTGSGVGVTLPPPPWETTPTRESEPPHSSTPAQGAPAQGAPAQGAAAPRGRTPAQSSAPSEGPTPLAPPAVAADAGAHGGAVAAQRSAAEPPADPSGANAPGSLDAAAVRRVWDEVLAVVRRRSPRAWAVVREASVRDVHGELIVLVFQHAVHANMFGAQADLLVDALREVLGGSWSVRPELASEAGATSASARPADQASRRQPTATDQSVTSAAPGHVADDGDWPAPAQLGGGSPQGGVGSPQGTGPIQAVGPTQAGGSAQAGSSSRGTGQQARTPGQARPAGGKTDNARQSSSAAGTTGTATSANRASGPGGTRAASGTRGAAGTAGNAGNAGKGSVWAEGPSPQEPPFDPDYDRTSPPDEDVDPDDEVLDKAVDVSSARQTSEDRAIKLLKEQLGAQEIGDSPRS